MVGRSLASLTCDSINHPFVLLYFQTYESGGQLYKPVLVVAIMGYSLETV